MASRLNTESEHVGHGKDEEQKKKVENECVLLNIGSNIM